MSTIGDIGAALPIVGGVVSAINNIGAEGRAEAKQKEYQNIQLNGAKELAELSKNNQLEMWNKTNYEAQMEHLKKAGLNPSLLYGKGGAGGATTGSGAVPMPTMMQAPQVDPNQRTRNIMELGMMMANKALIESQTNKNNADADATRGVRTKEGEQNIAESATRTASQNFDLEMKKTLQQTNLHNAVTQSELMDLEKSRVNANWETYLNTGYEGKDFKDPNTPIAKALKAGWERTLTDLQGAKTSNSIAEANRIIAEFTANMTKEGLSPNSPWYTKFMMDLLKEVGISPIDTLSGKADRK